MTKFTLLTAFGALMLATPVLAADPAAGEAEFKKCKACHSLTASDGTEVVKGGKTGPNLGGVVGRAVASVADFKYGESIIAVGAAGKVWDEASIAAYVADPAAWLAANGAGDGAKSKMSFKLAAGGEDMAAYLATIK
jgi:cytochrome c